jgi:hypothetical protein
MKKKTFHRTIYRSPMLTFAQTSPLASRTQLGVAHIGGLYCFSETDYLNEGAVTVLAIGAMCIKVSLSLDTDNPSPKFYPFHSQWPDLARHLAC